MIGVRLQGGPFDGDRAKAHRLTRGHNLPERLYVKRCPHCSDTDWFELPTEGAEVYRRDEKRRGWQIYVWTDEDLGQHVELTENVTGIAA